MKLSSFVNQVYVVAVNEAKLHGHEYLTPEHFLYSTIMFDEGKELIELAGGNTKIIGEDLNQYFHNYMPKRVGEMPMESFAFNQMLNLSSVTARNRHSGIIAIEDFIYAIFMLNESHAHFILAKNGVEKDVILGIIQSSEEPSEPKQVQDVKSKTSKPESERGNPHLAAYTVDLVSLAKEGKLDPLVGREDVLERTIQVLCRRLKNNPVHVGDPGVGKTAIVEGLAQRIAIGKVPEMLKNVNILRLDMSTLVAGTRYRGDFEERLVKLLEAVSALKNPIIYIDEIHSVIGTGSVSGGSMDATSIIKPYLSRGEIRFIGSTTHEEYKKHLEKDRALARRFARIDITEPSQEECVKILQGLRPYYENFHGVQYSDEILMHIVSLSTKHMHDRFLPDKAIDTMDEAGVFTRLNAKKSFAVTETAIEYVIARAAKVPEKSVSANENNALKTLATDLSKRVFGQEEAVAAITHAIHSARAGLNEPDRPVASLLFVGPTGVGKTEVTRQLAELLGIQLIRFDMSEYQEKHAVARLIGAPPGYVGYEEGGLLTDAIRRTPHCVLLLDEIEKAHADILNVLLQVLDYGTLTDNTGKKADFKNVIIIMTSNAGARELTRQTIGFDSTKDNAAADKAINQIFSPEFRNRLDAIIRFKGVDSQMALQIAKKSLDKLAIKLKARHVVLSPTKTALDFIAKKGLSETYGAREIIRLVENDVKKLLTQEVLFGELAKGGTCKLTTANGELKIKVIQK
ncbi:MAG: AAA family ATPase [Defluviitaleaceae bacterium]|nr:AAA family ATPase [Defluviitaleaceae bacterium]